MGVERSNHAANPPQLMYFDTKAVEVVLQIMRPKYRYKMIPSLLFADSYNHTTSLTEPMYYDYYWANLAPL